MRHSHISHRGLLLTGLLCIAALSGCDHPITVEPAEVAVELIPSTGDRAVITLTTLEIVSCSMCDQPTRFDIDVQVDIDYPTSSDRPLFIGVTHEPHRSNATVGNYPIYRRLEFNVADSAVRIRIGPEIDAHRSDFGTPTYAYQIVILKTNGVWHYNSPGQTPIGEGSYDGAVRWTAYLNYTVEFK